MTPEQKTATEAAKALAETSQRKEHMADAAAQHPATTTPVDRPLTPPAD